MRKLFSLIVCCIFLFDSVSFALSTSPASSDSIIDGSESRDAMRMGALREFLDKKGPGFEFSKNFYPEIPEDVLEKFKDQTGEITIQDLGEGDYPAEWNESIFFDAIEKSKFFVDVDVDFLEGVSPSTITIEEAFRKYINVFGQVPEDKIYIKVIDLAAKYPNEKGIAICETEILGKGKEFAGALVVYLDKNYLKGLEELRRNDKLITMNVSELGGEPNTRTFSLFWGTIFSTAMHEVTRLSKHTGKTTYRDGNLGHITWFTEAEQFFTIKGDRLQDDSEIITVQTGRRYMLVNKATRLWEVTSRCFPYFTTKNNNGIFNDRSRWILGGDKELDDFYGKAGALSEEFDYLSDDEKNFVWALASRINKEYYGGKGKNHHAKLAETANRALEETVPAVHDGDIRVIKGEESFTSSYNADPVSYSGARYDYIEYTVEQNRRGEGWKELIKYRVHSIKGSVEYDRTSEEVIIRSALKETKTYYPGTKELESVHYEYKKQGERKKVRTLKGYKKPMDLSNKAEIVPAAHDGNIRVIKGEESFTSSYNADPVSYSGARYDYIEYTVEQNRRGEGWKELIKYRVHSIKGSVEYDRTSEEVIIRSALKETKTYYPGTKELESVHYEYKKQGERKKVRTLKGYKKPMDLSNKAEEKGKRALEIRAEAEQAAVEAEMKVTAALDEAENILGTANDTNDKGKVFQEALKKVKEAEKALGGVREAKKKALEALKMANEVVKIAEQVKSNLIRNHYWTLCNSQVKTIGETINYLEEMIGNTKEKIEKAAEGKGAMALEIRAEAEQVAYEAELKVTQAVDEAENILGTANDTNDKGKVFQEALKKVKEAEKALGGVREAKKKALEALKMVDEAENMAEKAQFDLSKNHYRLMCDSQVKTIDETIKYLKEMIEFSREKIEEMKEAITEEEPAVFGDGDGKIGDMGGSTRIFSSEITPKDNEAAESLGAYFMNLLTGKGPGASVKPSDKDMTALWATLQSMQSRKAQILIASDSDVTIEGVRLTKDVKRVIRRINSKIKTEKKDGNVKAKVCTIKSILKHLAKKEDGYEYIVIASGSELNNLYASIKEDINYHGANMRDVRVLNMEIPTKLTSAKKISDQAIFAYQIKALFVALQARMLDSDEKERYDKMREQLKTMLKPMADKNVTDKELNAILDNLDTKKDETAEKAVDRVKKTLEGIALKLINTLYEKMEVLKMFGSMA